MSVPYYQKNRNGMSSKEKKRFKKDPQAFKMRYIYRKFRIDFQPLSKESPELPDSRFIKNLCFTTYIRAYFDLPCELWAFSP